MGRQIEFHALADDLGEFLEFACTGKPVIVTVMDADRPEIEPLANPCAESRAMTLWNQALIPTLERELVRRPPAPEYYRVSSSAPVLELIPSRETSWNGQPALLGGRVYGFDFGDAPKDYATWYESLARWIRSHFTRNPFERQGGYVGRAAVSWFQQGGVLLPGMFAPPVTPMWISFFEAQQAARAKWK